MTTMTATVPTATALLCSLFSRIAPAAAASGRTSGTATRTGRRGARHSMVTSAGALAQATSRPRQTTSNPASSGPARSGSATPTSGPRMSTARPEPNSTMIDAHGT